MIPIQTITNMARRQIELPPEMMQQNIDSYLGSLNDMEPGSFIDGSSTTLSLFNNNQINPESTTEESNISANPNFSVVPFENPMKKFKRFTNLMKGDPLAVFESGIQSYMESNNISNVEALKSLNITDLDEMSEAPISSPANKMNVENNDLFSTVQQSNALARSPSIGVGGVDETTPQAKPNFSSFDSLGAINIINNSPPSHRTEYS